jgi:hypothetical protein
MVVFPSVEVPLVEVQRMEVFPSVEVPLVVVQRMEVFPSVVALVEDRSGYNGELLVFPVVEMVEGIPRILVLFPFPSYSSYASFS